MRPFRSLILATFACVLSGCADDVEDLYSKDPAFCRITPVTAVQPLREALTSPGMFCTITIEPKRYICTREDGTYAPLNRTDEEAYGAPIYRAGFIVGTPSLSDGQTGQFYYVCYELACPSCYSYQMQVKAMKLQSGEKASCTACGRTYSLLYDGSLTEGPDGIKHLKRYHCSYTQAQDLFVIQN